MKRALITGVTGQDGSYLSELLLEKGYEVHGIKRRASSFNTQRIDHLFQEVHDKNARFILHYGDLSDSTNLEKLVYDIQPDEIYHLAAQSHVKVSWDCPEYTADCDALGTLRLLEAIRMNHLEKKTKFYQASTSELYGLIQEPIQKETTPFYPRSPYAVAKLYAYWICVNYRESFGLWAANGILFNHESPRRGETFVTRNLGNLNAKRDWGHAKDYVRGMWQIMQQDKPTDYVLATGTTTSIRDFCKMTFEELGINIEFKGEGVDEKGIDTETGKTLIEVDPRYFRPAEVDLLLGDSSKARKEIGWKPEYSLRDLVKEMVQSDLELAKKEKTLKDHGYKVSIPREV